MSTATPQHTDHTIDGEPIPTLDDIASQHFALTPWVARTPVFDKLDFAVAGGHGHQFQVRVAAGSR
jgi:threonine dehydratase